MALFSECIQKCARKVLDTADIVRDGILRQLNVFVLSQPAFVLRHIRPRIPRLLPVTRI